VTPLDVPWSFNIPTALLVVIGRPDLPFLGSVGVKHTDSLSLKERSSVYSLREEIDRGKWVVQWRLDIPWTTVIGRSVLCTVGVPGGSMKAKAAKVVGFYMEEDKPAIPAIAVIGRPDLPFLGSVP
jgi:hypothetical protein